MHSETSPEKSNGKKSKNDKCLSKDFLALPPSDTNPTQGKNVEHALRIESQKPAQFGRAWVPELRDAPRAADVL